MLHASTAIHYESSAESECEISASQRPLISIHLLQGLVLASGCMHDDSCIPEGCIPVMKDDTGIYCRDRYRYTGIDGGEGRWLIQEVLPHGMPVACHPHVPGRGSTPPLVDPASLPNEFLLTL